jgi:uncharacterized protein (DUF736 family)
MTDYDNRLSGALFKNDKGENPKRPDYRGSYTDENGVEFNVSAWMKKSSKGVTFMSFTMQLKEAKLPAAMQGQPAAQKANFQDDDGDKLPF